MSEERNLDASSVLDYIAPDLYDLAFGWWKDDIPFYVQRAKEANGPVLEVGCGTGRVYLPMLEAGADADGFDLHPGFLEVLERKAAAANLKPRVVQADMRDFTMPRRYELVVIPFRAFLHNLTTEDQLRTLKCCREHLESGGRLILDLFHPSFSRLIEPGDAWRSEMEFTHPETGAPLALWSKHQTDLVHQVRSVEMELREGGPKGAVAHRHAFRFRWVYRAEMELLLHVAGFPHFEVAGGFDGRPLVKDTDLMIWTAWKD
jgi:SAM-dependent methyltransferase